MKKGQIVPTGRESPFGDDELIVTKTDPKGRITYANDVFLRVARMDLADVLGQPHNIIRHPEMPRAVFKLLWDTIQAKQELFAYVVNLAANGDHYWVFAHVTPSLDASGNILGYHSNRRKPEAAQVERVKAIYAELLRAERGESDRRLGLQRSTEALQATLRQVGKPYDEFIFSI